jgi:hypothetical protein
MVAHFIDICFSMCVNNINNKDLYKSLKLVRQATRKNLLSVLSVSIRACKRCRMEVEKKTLFYQATNLLVMKVLFMIEMMRERVKNKL